jgi:hypothetical protein
MARIVRYADDYLTCFQHQADAARFKTAMSERLARFGLATEPTKTRMLAFGRCAVNRAKQRGERPKTFEFLGFVRHEVAYTAVMTPKGGHNLVCCHQYPTQTCGWSNPTV